MHHSLIRDHGLWAENSRNQAMVRAVELARAGGYAPVILVDQHSYTDPRYFRAEGLEPRQVHAENYGHVPGSLDDRSSYIVVYAALEPPPAGYWASMAAADPAFTKKYKEYRAAMETLPLVQEFGSSVSYLLEFGQINPEQRMQLRIFRKSAWPRE